MTRSDLVLQIVDGANRRCAGWQINYIIAIAKQPVCHVPQDIVVASSMKLSCTQPIKKFFVCNKPKNCIRMRCIGN